MTWTYLTSALAITPVSQIRFLIGDTIATDPQMQDEEISFALSTRASIYGAAAVCCRALATQISRQADSTVGEMHNLYSSRAKNYTLKASEYESQSAARGGGMPYGGGLSIADKGTQEQNSDRVAPQYNLGMDDNTLPVGPAGNETMTSVDVGGGD